MIPATPDEDFIAGVLADALRGQLRLGFADVARIAAATGNLDPKRVAPLALARWAAADPRARDILRWALLNTQASQ